MDINPTNNSAVLSQEEVEAFHSVEMSNVVSLDVLRNVLPKLLDLAQSKVDYAQFGDSSNPRTAEEQARVDKLQAERDLIEAMNTDLMMHDFGNFLDEL